MKNVIVSHHSNYSCGLLNVILWLPFFRHTLYTDNRNYSVLFHTDALSMLRVKHVTASTGRRLVGALLARVAPRSADSRTAQRLRTDDASQLTTTHVLRDLREARTCSPVYIIGHVQQLYRSELVAIN